MRNIFVFLGALLIVDADVFGDDVTLSVMEGDSVTLKPYTVILEDDSALWLFGDDIIAVKNADELFSISEGVDVRFRGRLELDKQTGSLTITNIRTKDTGLYKLQIKRRTETFKIFSVTVSGDNVKSVSVLEGDTVTLHTGVTDIQKADLKGPDGVTWSNRNTETGEITIRNIQRNQSGDYELEINTISMILHRVLRIIISDEMKTVSVKKGEPINLDTDHIEIQGCDRIILKIGDQLIAKMIKGTFGFITNDTGTDGRFKGRLSMPANIVSLTISDSRITDTGVYHLNMISSSHTIQRNISVTVSDSGSSGAVSGISGASVGLMLWAVTVFLLHEV